jgi:anhydro-N-acetylmuramic acid kinase
MVAYIGLMSGTSLDGITAAAVRFPDDDSATHDLIGFTVREYTPAQRNRLRNAMHEATPEEYCRLGFDLGEWLADAALAVLAESGLAPTEVRAIGSHGQTLWHVPKHATWQLGESAVIAERTGIDVVSDFRVRDVAAGGHGAPLVPIADALLYGSDTRWRLLQNVGGMANVTVVPPVGQRGRGEEVDLHSVRAFDTGPGVAVIDAIVRALYPELPYDIDGRIAASGVTNRNVLSALLADHYFAAEPPKSTGRESFGDAYAARVIDLCRTRGCGDADIVASAVALTAASIAEAYTRFVPEPADEVVISGGGAKHPVLLRAIRDAVAPRIVRPFDELYYDGEAKEAVAFALLAHLHLARRPASVMGATGARGPRVLGKLTPA